MIRRELVDNLLLSATIQPLAPNLIKEEKKKNNFWHRFALFDQPQPN